MTLTTVGYGDFQPSTDLSKGMAVIFAFSGISIIFYALSIFACEYFEHQEERFERLTRIKSTFFKDPMELSHDEKRVEDMTLSELIRRVRKNNRR
jgi:hypothetical protein